MFAGRAYYIVALSLGIPFAPTMIETDLRHFFPFACFIALIIGYAISTKISDTKVLERTYNGFVLLVVAILLYINGHLHNQVDSFQSANAPG